MKKRVLLLTILLILILLISGCVKKGSKKPEKIEQKEKAPEILKSVYTSIEELIKIVEVEEEEEKKSEITEALDKKIKKVHENWNKYEIEGTKKGATSDQINKFRESLNNLTLAIENLEYNNIIVTSSDVFLNMAPFFNLYRDEVYGEICLIKYYVYQGYILGEKGELDKGKEALNFSEEQVSRLNTKLEDDNKKLKDLDMLKKSIEDMKFSMKSNNKNLLKIKKDIVIKNLRKIAE